MFLLVQLVAAALCLLNPTDGTIVGNERLLDPASGAVRGYDGFDPDDSQTYTINGGYRGSWQKVAFLAKRNEPLRLTFRPTSDNAA